MPIAVQGGDSELPKPPPFHERLFPLLALRSSRPDSQTSLASCHTYESSGGSANQQMTSERPRSASQLRLTLNSVSPSPDDNLCH
ncbi:unnamed protein product [Toxocara canis]|nr:unnamed protein product [Toxocara canis]